MALGLRSSTLEAAHRFMARPKTKDQRPKTKSTMNTDAKSAQRIRAVMFNLPNQLTFLRLILSVVLFCFIACGWYLTSLWLFIVAAGTDWLDGYFARKYSQVTTLGRILDPFADKVIVCGTFIFLVAVPDRWPKCRGACGRGWSW